MDKPRVFISHHSTDISFAEKLRKELEKYGVNAFLAKYGDNGSDWRATIPEEIEKCHYFVVILSDHYHRGAYTDHEFGMAVMSKRKIRVINIDGTRAYGFIEKYHYRNISEIMDKADGSMFEAVNLIFHKDKEILLPFLLKGFCHSKSFDITRLFNSRLERLDYKFDITELNKIATAYINNHEIHDAVQIEYMMKILEKSLDKIKPELAVKIKNGFKCDWSSGHTVTPFYENQNFLQND